jgi:Flp pilus assembly pilin Flp
MKGGIEVGPTKPREKLKWRDELRTRGQGLVEYALILVAVAILIIVILTFIGSVVFNDMYSRITSGMGSAGGP